MALRNGTSSEPGSLPAWLESTAGEGPFILIAPHGGRAHPGVRAPLHPKVNDLNTADLTRELAGRLGAWTLINRDMDRNELDCNRISQLVAKTPRFLEVLLKMARAVVARHGRAIVILIHGWNVIEPRIDFGFGLRGDRRLLRPVGKGYVSASRGFINLVVNDLFGRLARHGITSSVGFRYPGADSQNLLQAFTARYAASDVARLSDLAALAVGGKVDAVQLELSVAVRWPGALRDRTIEAISHSLLRQQPKVVASAIRIARKSGHGSKPAANPSNSITRVGIEFYDSTHELGILASIDLSNGPTSARILLFHADGRIGLCTAEGFISHRSHWLTLGPLSFNLSSGRKWAMHFKGPLLFAPKGTTYLSIEQALAVSTLERHAELTIGFAPRTPHRPFTHDGAPDAHHPVFGLVAGKLRVGRRLTTLAGGGRVGRSLLGLGGQAFSRRRRLWALFDDGPPLRALELSYRAAPSGDRSGARAFTEKTVSNCESIALSLDLNGQSTPFPMGAVVKTVSEGTLELRGSSINCLPLSRPGSAGSRVITYIGFADFKLGAAHGIGMFEYSKVYAVEPVAD